MNRHADNDEANCQSHHELQEEIAQLVERERVLRCENDQLRAQLVEVNEEAHKKYDDLLMEYYNIKQEYEDDGLDKDGTANQVTVKTESDDEDVKKEIKVEIKEEDDEKDHDIIIKQEYMSAYIKTESSDVKVEIKEEIKEEDDEDDHDDDRGCDLRLVKKELASDDDDNNIDTNLTNLDGEEDRVDTDQLLSHATIETVQYEDFVKQQGNGVKIVKIEEEEEGENGENIEVIELDDEEDGEDTSPQVKRYRTTTEPRTDTQLKVQQQVITLQCPQVDCLEMLATDEFNDHILKQLDDALNVNEVVQPNLNEPNDILSRDQLNTSTNSVNFELSPSANCQMQLTNSSQIEQSADQQVDKADHEPNEPANHGQNQLPTMKQCQSRTRKRTAMRSGQVSMNGPMTNSKRTRVETELHRTDTVQEVSTAVALDLSGMDEENEVGGGEGSEQIEDDDDETELGEEDQGGHYKIEIVKLKCTEDGCEDEVADTDKLHNHLRVIHHISPYRCLAVGCNERFEQWGELGRHVKYNHLNISTWSCPHCTKTFKSHHCLYKHLHLYHFEGQFKCGYDACPHDRVATLRSEILSHQHSVHPSATIYTCQFNNCGKSFNKKSNFDNHQRIHQGVKPYKCTWDMCDYASTQQSGVITHIRTKHFHLPETQKKQHQLGIEDNRNPRDYLQKELDN